MQQLEDSVSKQTLRLANTDDLNTLVDFATKFHKNSVYSNREFNRDKITLFIVSLINNPKGLVLLLEDVNIPQREDLSIIPEGITTKTIGALIALIEETIFGLELHASELMLWVEEDYRNKDSWELVNAFEYWSKEVQKCSSISLSRLEDSIGAKLDKVYKSMGYLPVEHVHVKVF